MKKIISILTCSIIIFSSIFISFADTNTGMEKTAPLFLKFISEATISDIEVINSSGHVVNNDAIQNNLLSGNYDKVIELLIAHDLALSYEKSNFIGPYDFGEVTFSKDFYHLKKDSTGKFTKEWVTTLSGRYKENRDGTLTALGNPTMDVTADFGGSFSVLPSRFSTGYKQKNNDTTIEYYGSYTMNAKIIIPIVIGGFEFPIGHMLRWGQINVNHTIK